MLLDQNKTIGRFPAKATLDKLNAAQKSIADGGLFGAFTGFTALGGVGRNQDIGYTKNGAANAYRLVPPINRAVNLRADAHDSLPWKIIRNATNDPKNDVVVAQSGDNHPEHPFALELQKIYFRQKTSLFWLMEYADLVYGEIFIEYLRNDADIVRGLKWLNPLAVYIDTRYGEIFQFLYSDLNGQVYIPLARTDVAYDRFLNPIDDWRGLSRVNVAVDKINIYRNTNRFVEAFFRNNAQPGGTVSPPDSETSWTDIERNKIRDEFRRNMQGSDNAFSWLVAPRPLKIDSFTQANINEQYQINDPVMREIYAEFGVPIAMAGDNNGTAYQNNDGTLTWFYQNTVIPSARKRQFFINTSLMPFFDPTGDSRFEFDTTAYDQVSADDQVRANVAKANVEGHYWTVNEARNYTKSEKPLDKDYLIVEGVPVPLDELDEYWKVKLLVRPNPQEAGAVGQQLGVNTPAQAQQLEAAKPQGGDFGKSLALPATTIEGKSKHTDADDELRAWERKYRNSEYKSVHFEPIHLKSGLGRWLSHELEHSAGDVSAIKSAFAVAREVRADSVAWDDEKLNLLSLATRSIKSYEDTAQAFESELLQTFNAGAADEISRAKFSGSVRRALRVYGLQAFRDGMEDEGYSPESFNTHELDTFRQWQDEQSSYVSNLAKEVYSVGLSEADVESRVQLWINKSLNAIYYDGKILAAPNKMYTWHLGYTENHCVTCKANDGQTKSLKEWKAQGLPQSEHLACKGYNCDCTIYEAG